MTLEDKLIENIKQENLTEVKKLLAQGADPNHIDEDEVPALILAVKTGNINICQLLLDSRADIDQQDSDRNTALMYATCDNHEDIVELLIRRGSDTYLVDIYQKTAWDLALENYIYTENKKLIKIFLDYDPEVGHLKPKDRKPNQ